MQEATQIGKARLAAAMPRPLTATRQPRYGAPHVVGKPHRLSSPLFRFLGFAGALAGGRLSSGMNSRLVAPWTVAQAAIDRAVRKLKKNPGGLFSGPTGGSAARFRKTRDQSSGADGTGRYQAPCADGSIVTRPIGQSPKAKAGIRFPTAGSMAA
ncbi:hypothetical protein H2509_01970 [Stappia sp. F7233]|uniref:Uncharacterized protein n=1 Tax=Stappia albiluteola TaxID=2758565 RepID=A0A839AA29_9HYPH|nr:hypothetical protein [Stappia albiluteola]MBA5775888.1 hypothetical protein [Stappia albiluteola]